MTATLALSADLPAREGIAAWAAAAGTAGAILPGRVAQVLIPDNWDEHGHQYGQEVDPDDLLDAFSILEAVAAACRSVYREDPSWYPMPRGMEVGIEPDGCSRLIWRSDSHTITLRFGAGWSSADLPDRGGPNKTPHWAPNLGVARIEIEGDALADSPRVAAAVAASPTLQQHGWD